MRSMARTCRTSLVRLLMLAALPAARLSAQRSPEQVRAADDAADESRNPYPRNILLTRLGFEPGQLDRVDRGEVVLGNTLFDKDDVFAIAGALRVEGDLTTFVRTMHPRWRFAHPTADAPMGVFSDPPVVRDVAGMQLDPFMLDAIRKCKPGNCGIQLTTTAMTALRDGIDWTAPGHEQVVQERAREFLVAQVRAYQQLGYGDAEAYADTRRPIDRVAAFRQLLGHAMVQAAQEPRLHEYLAAYPRAPADGIEDTFYWIRIAGVAGLVHPTLSVVHAATWTDPSDSTHVTVADRLLYSTQYIVASLGETEIVRDRERPGSFYVIRLLRVRFRVGGGLAHGVIMKQVHGAMQRALVGELEMARTVARRTAATPSRGDP